MCKMLLCWLVVFSFTVLPATSEEAQNETLRSLSESGACILPLHPDNGRYEVSNVPNAHPGQTFDYVVLTVSCRRGYGVVESTDGSDIIIQNKIYCFNGKWSQTMPKCVRFCKLKPDPSVSYMCQVSATNGFKICDKYVSPGTPVNPICNTPIYYSAESLLYMKCTAGTWNYVAKCKVECGRVTPEGTQLIIDGRQAKRGELPWHVGIYRKTTTPYQQICGGSLVSNNIVISAAHCFYKNVVLPESNFSVAIGKLYRNWDDENDVEAQKSNIKKIIIPKLFEGEAANFQEDIAILILERPFTYQTYVRPVCLNFDTNFDKWQLQKGKIGKVAGWGLTNVDGSPSKILKVVEIPYVNIQTCINTLPLSFREYITGDKFCAGYTNGTALCKGDSGGGLVFVGTELGIDRHYLRGIVSAAPKNDDKTCNDEVYTTFTQITKHEEFIKQSLATPSEESCSLSEFQCNDGGCIDQEAECNGKNDCADGSDESDYLCKPGSNGDAQTHSDSCILPPYPNHGTYKVANLPNARPGQSVDTFVLTVTCDEGYGIADTGNDNIETYNQQVYCINGEWYQIMPKCIQFCKVERDYTVRFAACRIPGAGYGICQDYVPPGTTIIPKCRNNNYYSSEVLPFMTCLNGSWDYIAKCKKAYCEIDGDQDTNYMCLNARNEFKPCYQTVKSGIIVKPVCKNPINNNSQVLQNMTCTLGNWNYVAKCKTDFCSLYLDPGIRYMCHDPDTKELKICNSTVPVGTSVKPVCNLPYYYSTEPLKNMNCTSESWDYYAKCQPECGRITTIKLRALTNFNGDSANEGTLILEREIIPWHVGIKLKNDLSSVFTLGTLVRQYVVISGAFRFYDIERKQINYFTKYVAEVRESGFLDTDTHVQRSDVRYIYTLPSFRGPETNFLTDIAALFLTAPFVFNSYVSPVCIDFDFNFEEQQLAEGNTGKVGYWGQLDRNEVNFVDTKTCLDNLPSNLSQLIAEDKFCFTYANESGSFLFGNLGAGVFAPRNDSGVTRYYFRGILHDGCYSHPYCHYNYAWSTRISRYTEFLDRYLRIP